MPCPKRWRTASAARVVDLRAVPNAEPGMSPMEIWCNEAQERYVLAVVRQGLARFEAIASASAARLP